MAERRLYPDCINASNPYHECVEACLRRIADGQTANPKLKKKSGSFILVIPRRLSMKKKKEPEQHPHFDEPTLKNFTLSDSLSPRDLSFKKVESWNAELNFPKSHSKKNPPNDTRNLQSQPSSEPISEPLNYGEIFLEKSNDGKPGDSGKVDSAENGCTAECARNKAFGSRTSSVTASCNSSEVSDEEVHKPNISDSCVSVGIYCVKENCSSILKSIIDKYGDIAAKCNLKSVAMRSFYLECVCSIIQTLQSSNVSQLREPKIREMSSMVKDTEAAGMDVGWLRSMLDEVMEAVKLKKQCLELQATKRNHDCDLESARKELELQLADLSEKEKAVEVARAQVADTRARLRELEQQCSNLLETVVSIKSKVDKVDLKAMVAKIL